MPGRVSENRLQTIKDRDTWAIYKLWSNWQAPADMRLEVQGGHLYRRGSYAWLSEAGAVTSAGTVQSHRRGQVEEIVLKISAVDKFATGYQLAVTLPDKQATLLREYCRSLKDIVVWLEMHGREATRLEQSVSNLKERWAEFCDACEGLGPYAEADPRCREALSKLDSAADQVRGALEDLADEIPASIWEGFDDV